jgi:RecA-family ATPase
VEAERALLGAVLLNPGVLGEALAVVSAADEEVFADARHRVVWKALAGMHAEGGPIDSVLLAERLLAEKALTEAGGAAYLGELTGAVPTSANVRHYAEAVRRAAQARRLLALGLRMGAVARQGRADQVEALLAQAGALPSAAPALAFDDFSDYAALAAQPIDWVFEGMLVRGSAGVLGARGGAYKSTLLLHLAVSVATGRALLPSFRPRGTGQVLAVFAEDAPAIVAKRLRALTAQHHMHEALAEALPRLHLCCGRSAPLVESGPYGRPVRTEAFHALHAQAKRMQPDLILLDPAQKLIAADTNDNAVVSAFMTALQELAAAAQGAVLVAHHLRKDGAPADAMALRGGGAFCDEARWAAVLQREGEEEQALVLQVVKANYAPLRRVALSIVSRDDAAALREHDHYGERLLAVAEAVARWLRANGAELTVREIVSRPEGKMLRMAVAKEHHFATREVIRDAITVGLKAGFLSEEERQRPGSRNTIPILKPALYEAPTAHDQRCSA